MDYSTLGERIRSARKALSLSQESVAHKVGISTSFWGHIERGTRKPSLETVVKVSQTLRVSIDHLVYGSNTAASYCEKLAFHKILK